MQTKPIIILTLIFISIIIEGCLSVTTISNANKTRYKNTYTTIDKDIIYHMAIINTETTQQSLAFFGKKYTYLVNKGADKIKLTAQLNGNYLQFENPIYINRGENNELQTFMQFIYQKPNSNYSKQEIDILDQFCNTQGDNKKNKVPLEPLYYQCQIYINGTLYQASKQQATTVSLKQGQPIVIRQIGTQQYKQRSNLLALPLTAVLDIVTLPFQMVGVGATLAVMHE